MSGYTSGTIAKRHRVIRALTRIGNFLVKTFAFFQVWSPSRRTSTMTLLSIQKGETSCRFWPAVRAKLIMRISCFMLSLCRHFQGIIVSLRIETQVRSARLRWTRTKLTS